MTLVSSDPSVAPMRLTTFGPTAAVFSTLGMTVLFGSEAVFAALALDWAASGLLHLPASATYGLGAVPLAAATYATFWIARRTWRYERLETRIDDDRAT